MICIGGVCIPYSAVVPFLLMGFKWVFAKLNAYGLLPGFVAEMMNLPKSPSSAPREAPKSDEKEALDDSKPSSQKNVVEALESQEQFDDLLKKNEKFVVKFTATWCGPCHKIHPFYQQKCAEYTKYAFITVDVDDFDEISGKYSVAMMPTFIIVRGDSVLGTYRGSSEPELEMFLNEHL